MSNTQKIAKFQVFTIKSGALPKINTETGYTIAPEETSITISDAVSFREERVRITPEVEQPSLMNINQRLHSKNPPLEGGDTDSQEVSATSG